MLERALGLELNLRARLASFGNTLLLRLAVFEWRRRSLPEVERHI
jgi:hypothetical protein